MRRAPRARHVVSFAHRHSGGYVTTHSTVRNGRVFNVKLSDIRQTHPTVETWNSCEWCTSSATQRRVAPWPQCAVGTVSDFAVTADRCR